MKQIILLFLLILISILPAYSQTRPHITDVRTISTMAELRTMGAGSAVLYAKVDGYYSPFDAGGGEFVWDASSVDSDNNGTIICPTGHTGAGRWIRLSAQNANVLHFGVVASATVDSIDNFNQAIAWASSTGKKIKIPAGEYGISAPLTFSSSAVVEGDGKKFTIIYALANMPSMLQFPTDTATVNNTLFTTISGLSLRCLDKAERGIQGCLAHASFEDINVLDATEYAFDIFYGWCNNFRECIATSGHHGFYIHHEANNVNLIGCKAFGNNGIGYLFAGYNINMFGCNVEKNDVAGVYIYNGGNNNLARFNINNCYFESNATVGVAFDDAAVGTVKSHIIVNNCDVNTFPESLTVYDASHTRYIYMTVENPYVYPAPQLNTVSLTYGSFTPVSMDYPSTDIPTFGYWVRGQRVINHNATESAAIGWVCTGDGILYGDSDGHPATATWRALGYPGNNYIVPISTIATIPYELGVSSVSIRIDSGIVTEFKTP